MSVRTLVILAAGRGTRFGGPKQFTQFGHYKKTLMEYNICHAIDNGYTNVVIIIQKQHESQLTTQVIDSLPKQIKVSIVFQNNDDLPDSCSLNDERTKPLGTAHALWCARHKITDHFVVINADDYYGPKAFELTKTNGLPTPAYMVGYYVEQTLSKNGGVNRGLCQLSPDSTLLKIEEVYNIHKTGKLITGKNINDRVVKFNSSNVISMNFWCFNTSIFSVIEQLLIQAYSPDKVDIDCECYLPDAAMQLLSSEQSEIRVLTSHDRWFGVTYAADSSLVESEISNLIDKGLFSSLESSERKVQ